MSIAVVLVIRGLLIAFRIIMLILRLLSSGRVVLPGWNAILARALFAAGLQLTRLLTLLDVFNASSIRMGWLAGGLLISIPMIFRAIIQALWFWAQRAMLTQMLHLLME